MGRKRKATDCTTPSGVVPQIGAAHRRKPAALPTNTLGHFRMGQLCCCGMVLHGKSSARRPFRLSCACIPRQSIILAPPQSTLCDRGRARPKLNHSLHPMCPLSSQNILTLYLWMRYSPIETCCTPSFWSFCALFTLVWSLTPSMCVHFEATRHRVHPSLVGKLGAAL